MNIAETLDFHILIAEDDPDDIDFLCAALHQIRHAHHISVVKDGEAALNFLQSSENKTPHLIFLDLNMPKIDGYGVLKFVKSHHDFKHIPIIVMTTASDNESIIRAYRLHANSFITKPSSFTELKSLIDSIAQYWLSSVGLPALH